MSTRVDYEGRVIKSAISNPRDIMFPVITTLTSEDFKDPGYRKAFNVLRLAGKKKIVDYTSLSDFMVERGVDVKQILSVWDSTYSVKNIKEPIRTVKNRTALEKLKKLYLSGLDAVKKANTDSIEHIQKTIKDISLITNSNHENDMESVVAKLIENRDYIQGKDFFGPKTGMDRLDFYTKGMQKKTLWLLGGYTSVGKSWFGIHMASKWFLNNKKTLYISLEMPSEEILWRIVAKQLEMPIFQVKTGIGLTDIKKDMIQGEIDLAKDYPLYIQDNLMTWDEVLFSILKNIYSNGVECVVIDYVQNIVVEGKTEYESMSIIIRELQRISVENNVFVLALSQVNRESQKYSSNVFGFKGSGNLENAADVAIVINKGETEEERIVNLGKNRSGVIGKMLCNVEFSKGIIQEVGDYVEKPD